MIPDLVLGGTSQIVTKDHQYIQLENGYIIEKKGVNTNLTRNKSFMKEAEAYFLKFGRHTPQAKCLVY